MSEMLQRLGLATKRSEVLRRRTKMREQGRDFIPTARYATPDCGRKSCLVSF